MMEPLYIQAMAQIQFAIIKMDMKETNFYAVDYSKFDK